MTARKFRHRLACALAAYLSLTLAACALTDAERIERVKPGMTPQQVESYLGPPTGVHFDFRGGVAEYYGDEKSGIQHMTVALAIGPPSPAWPQSFRDFRAEMQAQFGLPKQACTDHRIGNEERRCCFVNNRLVSVEKDFRPSFPVPASSPKRG